MEEFTWKQRLDMFTCTECGRCREVCPTHLTGKPLSPKGFMKDLRTALYTVAGDLVDTAEGRADEAAEARLEERKPLIGGWVDEETIWACTTCRYCESACPVTIPTPTRSSSCAATSSSSGARVSRRKAQTAFNGMERQGNPWNLRRPTATPGRPGSTSRSRSSGRWKRPSGPRRGPLLESAAPARTEDRGKKVSLALLGSSTTGVKFAILGSEETCSRDSARRLGNEYLFQTLAQQNVETLNGYGVKRIVTNCPHCFNTLSNGYPDFGGEFEWSTGPSSSPAPGRRARAAGGEPAKNDLLPRRLLPRPPARTSTTRRGGPRGDSRPHADGASRSGKNGPLLWRRLRAEVATRRSAPGSTGRGYAEIEPAGPTSRRRLVPVLHG
ncbi:MAG: (Fe-S)-binding protein [Holophagales bacterium]|nr:(Fe-S)-binding protein [Holophagales bacterium]